MTIQEAQLRNDVMRRVRRIYFFRRLTSPLTIEAVIFAAIAVGINFLVSIPDIIANVSRLREFRASFGYLAGSFMRTEMSVQLSLLVGTIVFAFLVKDTVKNVQSRGLLTLQS